MTIDDSDPYVLLYREKFPGVHGEHVRRAMSHASVADDQCRA